jgi:hypothetical protein
MLPDLKVKAEPKKALPLLGLGARCFRYHFNAAGVLL